MRGASSPRRKLHARNDTLAMHCWDVAVLEQEVVHARHQSGYQLGKRTVSWLFSHCLRLMSSLIGLMIGTLVN